jgi:hypothetical protein
LRQTLKDGLLACSQADRPANVLLANSALRFDLADAMSRFTVNATDFSPITDITAIVYFDGGKITRGNRTYQYGGVPATEMFLIEPALYLIELIKHDLRIEAGPGDLSRLIAQQIGRRQPARRLLRPQNGRPEDPGPDPVMAA